MDDFHEEDDARRLRGMAPSVAVTFHGETCPLLGWNAGSRLVDFISQYTGFFFESPANHYLDREEVEDAINYILLELLENARKYSASGDIDVFVEARTQELLFTVDNPVDNHEVPRIQTKFQELHSDDPADLLVRRIEENAANPESLESGLGLLTILSDYGATVSWRFHTGAKQSRSLLTVTTRFPVHRSQRQ